MKKRRFKLLQSMACIALMIGWAALCLALRARHCASYPALYATSCSSLLLLPFLLLLVLLIPMVYVLVCLRYQYRLVRLNLLFVEITRTDRLRICWCKQLRFGAFMLPPRTDGTSPYLLPQLSSLAFVWAYAALTGLGVVLLWPTMAARTLLRLLFVLGEIGIALLLPLESNDILGRILAFRRSRDLRRAWECGLYITAALERGEQVENMPDEWFLSYPDALEDHPYVRVNNFNRASRLINTHREAEAYELLRPFFDLKPGRDTYMLIAGAILNGALCEVFADLPPMCLSQLDYDTLKMPLPPAWERSRLTAQYARALFLRHDEAEAAAILPALETEIEKQGHGRETLLRLQEKAGLLPQESNQ